MKGDYSRVPYNAADNITRVLFQQGRPLVEADLNEALMMLQANQETLLGLHAKGPDSSGVTAPFSPEPFLAREEDFTVTPGNQLSVSGGAIAFDGLLLRSQTTRPLARFRTLGLSTLAGYMVTSDTQDPDSVGDATYVLAVAANERQMLLSEMDARHADIAQFRGANLWKIDWQYVLVPVTDENGNGAIEESEVTLEADNLKAKKVHGDPPPIQIKMKSADKNRFAGRLLRLEVHETKEVSGKKTVTLKLALDNASHTFRVQPSNGSRVTFLPVGIDHDDFPVKDEAVEVESLRSINWMDGKPNELLKVIDADGTELSVSQNISLEATDQIRRWSFVFSDKELVPVPPPPASAKEYSIKCELADGLQLEVIVPKSEVNGGEPAKLIPGDAWSFKTDGFTEDGNDWTKSAWIEGFRKRRFFAPIGAFTYEGTADPKWVPVTVGGLRNLLSSILPSHQEGIAPLPLVGTRATTSSHDTVASYVNDVTVSRFFPKASTLAMRKWLASATWGELDGLSAADLRERVLHDCNDHGCDNDQLEADLRMVVSQRQKLLNHSQIALA